VAKSKTHLMLLAASPSYKDEGRCSRTGQKDDGVRDRDHLDLCLAPIDEQFNPIDKTAII
jgi:hypothetical protein